MWSMRRRRADSPKTMTLTEEEMDNILNALDDSMVKVIAEQRLKARETERRREWEYRRRRLNIYLVSFALTLTLGLPALASVLTDQARAQLWPFGGSSTSVPSPSPTGNGGSLSATGPPTQEPAASPSPSSPVIVSYAGTDAPVVVVLQQPSETSSSAADYAPLVTAISGGLVAVGGTITAIIWAIRRQPGGEPPAPPSVPGA